MLLQHTKTHHMKNGSVDFSPNKMNTCPCTRDIERVLKQKHRASKRCAGESHLTGNSQKLPVGKYCTGSQEVNTGSSGFKKEKTKNKTPKKIIEFKAAPSQCLTAAGSKT